MKNHVGTLALSLPLVLAGAGSALAAQAGAAADAPATCSEATLRGTYLFATNGLTVRGKGKGPFAAGGYEVHDGHGHASQIVSYSINGKITRFERGTGKVTVNADCTGTAIYTDGTHYDLFIAPGRRHDRAVRDRSRDGVGGTRAEGDGPQGRRLKPFSRDCLRRRRRPTTSRERPAHRERPQEV